MKPETIDELRRYKAELEKTEEGARAKAFHSYHKQLQKLGEFLSKQDESTCEVLLLSGARGTDYTATATLEDGMIDFGLRGRLAPDQDTYWIGSIDFTDDSEEDLLINAHGLDGEDGPINANDFDPETGEMQLDGMPIEMRFIYEISIDVIAAVQERLRRQGS